MIPAAASFATDFVPAWLRVVADPHRGGLAEWMDAEGRPETDAPRTTLTQARCAFALAHLHLATGDPRLLDAAVGAWRFLDAHLRHPEGGYRMSVAVDGEMRRAYDQSFVLLALVTLKKAAPALIPAGRIESLWSFVETLTDPETGALWEDDKMARNGAASGARRGQNPQMHMLEAVLQAFEMTRDAVWMERATRYVAVARDYLIDRETGAVREWVGPDLHPLPGPDGTLREPGHQYEWAWLLHRYADLGGDEEVRELGDRMIGFVESHGLGRSGPLKGAPFDALDADGTVREPSHLLWPATEAGKYYAWRHLERGEARSAEMALALEQIVFDRFFQAGSAPCWSNQLDGQGRPLQPVALSRLVYHVALFVTEGARAGLWPLAKTDTPSTIICREEFSR